MEQRLILASASPRRREILAQAGIPFTVQVADFDEEGVREALAVKEREMVAAGEALTGGRLPRNGEGAGIAGGFASDGQGGIRKEDYPVRYVKALALGKAQAVLRENADMEGVVVLGADTVVVHRGEILNKPVDLADARRMLLRLQGDVHAVYTGVALCRGIGMPEGNPSFENFAVRTEVVFYPMSGEEIEAYLACGEYADKAGAYAIQGRMAAYIREIHGDYYNVVGLPLSAVVHTMARWKKR